MTILKEKKQMLIRRIVLICVDMIAVLVAFYGSMLLYFNCNIEPRYTQVTYGMIGILLVVSLGLFVFMKLYPRLLLLPIMVKTNSFFSK